MFNKSWTSERWIGPPGIFLYRNTQSGVLRMLFVNSFPGSLHWFRLHGWKKFSLWSKVQFQSGFSDIAALIKDPLVEDIFPLTSGTVPIQDFRYCCIDSGSSGGRHFSSELRYNFNSGLPILQQWLRIPGRKTFSRWYEVQFKFMISDIAALFQDPRVEDIFPLISGPISIEDFQNCCIN